jgi:hypothetical protein
MTTATFMVLRQYFTLPLLTKWQEHWFRLLASFGARGFSYASFLLSVRNYLLWSTVLLTIWAQAAAVLWIRLCLWLDASKPLSNGVMYCSNRIIVGIVNKLPPFSFVPPSPLTVIHDWRLWCLTHLTADDTANWWVEININAITAPSLGSFVTQLSDCYGPPVRLSERKKRLEKSWVHIQHLRISTFNIK